MAFWQWSKTDANNATADPDINWQEGQAPSTINNSARSMMARIAEYRDDIFGLNVTTGTAGAYVLSSNQGLSSTVPDAFEIVFRPHIASTGAMTLDVDGTGDKPLRLASGVELPAGALRQGGIYSATYLQATNEWVLFGVVDPAPFVAGVPTGATQDFYGATIPAGYVPCSGRTIGDASSAATERANADAQALFVHLWTDFPDALHPVLPGGRGASAAADFAAHKTITLPDFRGRASIGLDNMGGTAANRVTSSGSSLDGTTLGASGGAQNVALTANQNGPHNHGGSTSTTGAHRHFVANGDTAGTGTFLTGTHLAGSGQFGGAANNYILAGDETDCNIFQSSSAGDHAHTIQSDGSGAAHTNMPPAVIVNKIIKL